MAIFPAWTLTRRIITNATLIWLGLRLGAVFVGVSGTGVLLACGFVAAATGLAIFDIRRRSRHTLLENLGLSGLAVGVVAMIPAVVFESALLMVARL